MRTAVDLITELRTLYFDGSKHASYQNVPTFVEEALGFQVSIDEGWRSDKPRYRYLLEHCPLRPGEHVVDIGANTGYFSLSLAQRFTNCQFTAYELHPQHVEFMRLVRCAFQLYNLDIDPKPVEVEDAHQLPRYDLVLFMNVLHHLGCDFDVDVGRNNDNFRHTAVTLLSGLRQAGNRMLFQMGTNRGGDKSNPIVDARDEPRKLAFLTGLLQTAGWTVDHIAFAQQLPDGDIRFRNLPGSLANDICALARSETAITAQNMCARAPWLDLDRFPGEFYRRPLILCRAAGEPS